MANYKNVFYFLIILQKCKVAVVLIENKNVMPVC